MVEMMTIIRGKTAEKLVLQCMTMTILMMMILINIGCILMMIILINIGCILMMIILIIIINRKRTGQKLVWQSRWLSVRSQRWPSKAKKLLKGLRC